MSTELDVLVAIDATDQLAAASHVTETRQVGLGFWPIGETELGSGFGEDSFADRLDVLLSSDKIDLLARAI